MPALKPVLYNTCDIDFGDNKLRNLDGINLTGNPQIGMFVISDNAIETLAGSPKRVSGRCDVSNNNLTTLIGMPGYIGGDFNCYNNFLKRSTVISKLSIVGGKK